MVLKIIDEKFIKDKGHKKTSHNGKLYDVFLLEILLRKYEASRIF
jgi:hypothetical protein